MLKAYCSDELKDKVDLKKARDEKLKEMGLGGRRSRTQKPEPGHPPLLIQGGNKQSKGKQKKNGASDKQAVVEAADATTEKKIVQSPAKDKVPVKKPNKAKEQPAVAASSPKKVAKIKKSAIAVEKSKQIKRPAAAMAAATDETNQNKVAATDATDATNKAAMLQLYQARVQAADNWSDMDSSES